MILKNYAGRQEKRKFRMKRGGGVRAFSQYGLGDVEELGGRGVAASILSRRPVAMVTRNIYLSSDSRGPNDPRQYNDVFCNPASDGF
jgi:hypothetical protein